MVTEESSSTRKQLRRALNTFKPKYRKFLLHTLDDEEIDSVCEFVFNIFKDRIHLKNKNYSFNILRLNCFLTNII